MGKVLFNLKLDVVFYDTTSIYFEGEGPEDLAQKGFSKDNHPESNQVVIGILMTSEGVPIGCKSFPGNLDDSDPTYTLKYQNRPFFIDVNEN